MFPIIAFGQWTSIPDQNFEQRLINLGYDNLIDGQVLSANISGVTNLNVSYSTITDLTGIEDFISLNTLNLRGTFSSFTLPTTLTQLNYLAFYNNTNLSSLNLNSQSLETLTFGGGNSSLTSVDTSNLPNLKTTPCSSGSTL